MKKTKEQLKTLSNSTFRDNDNGEIQPSGHRTFNNDLIDSLALDEDGDWVDAVVKLGSTTVNWGAKFKITKNYVIFHFDTFVADDTDMVVVIPNFPLDIESIDVFSTDDLPPMFVRVGSYSLAGEFRLNITSDRVFNTSNIMFMLPIPPSI